MLKSILKSFTSLLIVFVLLITVTSCTSREAKSVIRKIDSIVTITESSGELLKEIQTEYNALSEEDKAVVQNENYAEYEAAVKAYNSLMYSSIKRLIEQSVELESSFFAQYYDIKELSIAKENAVEAINNSDNNKYADVYAKLNAAVKDFNDFINIQKRNSLSIETNNGKYPFEVDASKIYFGFCLAPYVKQSSAYPSNPCFFDSDTTDELPIFHFEVKNSVGVYSYELRQIDTKWIEVQDGSGNLKKAFVNTEIVLYAAPESWEPNNTLYPLGEGACYLFYTEENGVTLAIKDLVNNNGYILYHY